MSGTKRSTRGMLLRSRYAISGTDKPTRGMRLRTLRTPTESPRHVRYSPSVCTTRLPRTTPPPAPRPWYAILSCYARAQY
eukprot:619046-Rhodomonas_salina.7